MEVLVLSLIAFLYLTSLTNTIFGGDAGDLVSAILTSGFPHPPGYPFYTFLGIIFNQLIPNFYFSAAGKITLISFISTLGSIITFFFILKTIFKKDFNHYFAILTILILALNYVIWLYSIVPEVFPLNTFITLLIFYFALKYFFTQQKLNLLFLSFFIGLGFSHHHTFVLVLPSIIYLFLKIKEKITLKRKDFFFLLLAFFLGFSFYLYIFYSYYKKPEIVWGEINSFFGFLALFLRQNYGTFVPGSFITQIPTHRLLQLKNLFLFTLDDFTFAGIFLFFLGILGGLKYLPFNREKKYIFNAFLINFFFFGSFFFFYANFPLTGNFFFGTLERFLHIYYFFFAFFIYLGFQTFFLLFKAIINKYLSNQFLKKFSLISIIFLFSVIPTGIFLRNNQSILALKNDKTAENLGIDVLNNSDETPATILLSQDTVLFNTQYVYYTQKKIRKNKIIIHANKLYTPYYKESLKIHYPNLKIPTKNSKNKDDDIQAFIKINKDKYHIYSNERYPLQGFKNYDWIPYGILFKLTEKSKIDSKINAEKIANFWKNSLNKKLVDEVKNRHPKFRNFFTADILRIYSIGLQNSAFYLLENNYLSDAFYYINQSLILAPDDLDNYFLLSQYYQLKKDCLTAEKTIDKAIKIQKDNLYLNQLINIAEKCYQSKSEKERIKKKINQYLQKIPLNRF